jgi:hypothetical protein
MVLLKEAMSKKGKRIEERRKLQLVLAASSLFL